MAVTDVRENAQRHQAVEGLRATEQQSNPKPFTVIENVKGQRVPLIPPDYVDDVKINLPANAVKVLEKRYLRRDLDGSLLETPAGMFYRLAYHIAQVEEQHQGDAAATAQVFYDLLTERRFYPNSPTFTGAGTPLGQLAACFTADMRVTSEQGVKRIADLEIGDRVLTHEGRYRPVTELFQRAYEGELLRIKIKLIGTTVEVTPEHPILTPGGWVKAGELNNGDLVTIGTAHGTRTLPRFDLAESVYAEEMEMQATESAVRVRRPSTYQNSGRQAEWGTRFIEVTPALARLCGYYVAEGTIGADERYVRFTFNTDELEFQKDVVELVETIFGAPINQSQSNHGNWMNINAYSRSLVTWFRTHFGRGSDKKRLPVWLQYADREIQEAFLIGLLRGDGMYSENLLTIKGRKRPKLFRTLRLTLSNPGLIQQAWQMCLRLGYDAAIRPVDTTYVTPNAKETAQINMPPLQSRDLVQKAFGQRLPEPDMRYVRHVVQRDGDQVFFPIERIESVNFNGTVYNCEVDEDHSYVTEGVVVHNCFVLPIEDDMGKRSDGIFSTLRVAALIQQTGGGNGFSFSRLRPKNDIVHTSSGRATGPVGFLRVYDQAFGEIAQGGCLLPDTLVFTERGLLRLDEIVDVNQPGWQPHNLRMATDQGWRTSQQKYNNGVAPVLRVHTREGLSLAGTPNHHLKVMTENGPEWRKIEELQTDDWILVRLGQHSGTLQPLRQPQRQHGNQNWPTLPKLLDEELAFFMGCLTGDGFIAAHPDDHRIGVSVAHTSYLMDEMPVLIQRLFGVTVHKQQKLNDRSVTFVVDNRAVKDFLQRNGLDKARSRDARVPRLVRQSSPEIVGAYLRGLFEADGSLSHGYPALTTTSARLVEEVATLLIGLGCPVRIRSMAPGVHKFGTATIYHLRIQSTVGLQAWRAKIGCDQRSRFVAAYAWESDQKRESVYPLPAAAYWLQPVLDVITQEQIDKRGRGMDVKLRSAKPRLRRSLLRYMRGERQFTRSGFDELKRIYPEFATHARSPEGLWFVQVSAIEPIGEHVTLDLEVDDNHTYLAYGMVTHNSRRGANMAVLRIDHPDIEDFITCKAEEGTVANFNISVAVTDEFVKQVQADGDFALRNPRDGKIWKTVRARELFNKIVKYAHHNGEPGILFIDAANRSNPVPHLYELEATNPCVTGDTLIYTNAGLRRADALYASQMRTGVVLDSRFGEDAEFSPVSSQVFLTGSKPVFQLKTKEGYTVKATDNHQVMTPKGWMELNSIQPGDKVHILNRKGGFGDYGSLSEGRVMGWLFGDGTFNIANGVGLMFFGEEQKIAPLFADHVNQVLANHRHKSSALTRVYSNTPTIVSGREETRITSERLRDHLAALGVSNKDNVPHVVFTGAEQMQRGFLQGLFSADGTVVDNVDKGVSVRLWSNNETVLSDVQQLLLNFGIASKIHLNRKVAGMKSMPDGHGGLKDYQTKAGHELIVSKDNLRRFQVEIGFVVPAKIDKLNAALTSYGSRGPYAEYFVATVESITPIGIEPVYDLHEPLTHSFIANGLVVHNCGEQWLGPYENCCLGSINLAVHVAYDADGQPQVDWDLLRRSTYESTCFLDNVVTANAYVPAIPEVAAAAYRARRIGLGIMGLGDLMYHMGIRYGSEEGQEFAAQIMEFVRFHCMEQSIKLADERGPFLSFDGSIYDPKQPGGMKWQPSQPIAPFTRDWQRPALSWPQIVAGIAQHGIRNAAQTTVAPTGTIATVCGCEGYGCEPVFALGYTRHFKDGDKDVELVYTSPLFEQALNATNLSEEKKQAIKQQVATYGTCQDIADLPADLRNTFAVSNDITAEAHVRMQAAIQAFVDNSISKTCNFPEGATEADVAQAYLLAWELGCKGLTVYVTGSRQQVVLETKATKQKKDEEQPQPAPALNGHGTDGHLASTNGHGKPQSETVDIQAQAADVRPIMVKRPRPNRLQGATYRKETPLGKAYITVNSDERNEPFEVFLNVGKAGSEVSAVSEAIGRLISLVLRMPGSLPPSERLRWVTEEIADIGGGRPMGFGAKRVRSLPDGIAQVLAEYLSDLPPGREELQAEQLALPIAQRPIGDICPECGEATLLNVEGCRKCQTCGYSEC